MDFLTVVSQMVSLFIIMIIGYIMYKVKVIDDAATVRYTKMVLNISLPAQIITSFVENQGIVSNMEVLQVFGISLFSYLVYFLLALVFVNVIRVKKQERGTYLFMSMFANVGFMGYPVITTIFGDEAMIYAVIFNVVFNILVYSVGILFISSGKGEFRFNPELLINMSFISAIVSIIMFFARIRLPQVVMTSFGYLGNLTTPVAMLILGATIASMPVKELFDEWRIYIFTVFRLAVIPLAMMVIFKILPMASSLIVGIMIVMAAMPVATNCTMLSIEYGGDTRLAAKGIFFSTVLSVVTIPLIAVLCA
ncbi:MAG: AEC family transporter [Eubacteriales bacterium]|nr:AEC family transporter [Eubacteriales bacterium]